MDSRMTRHWIQSFHRVTLYPHLHQPATPTGRLARPYHRSPRAHARTVAVDSARDKVWRSRDEEILAMSISVVGNAPTQRVMHNGSSSSKLYGSSVIHDSPLFNRQGAGRRRWPLGGPESDAPRYRIRQAQDEFSFLGDREFNPFSRYEPKTNSMVLSAAESAALDSQCIHPLSPTAQNRIEILRAGARLDLKPVPSIFEAEVAGVQEVGGSEWFLQPVERMPPAPWPLESYIMDVAQTKMVEDMVDRIGRDRTAPLEKHELATDLQRLGRATLVRSGLPVSFVDASTNQQDVIDTGLDILLASLPHSTSNRWAGELVDILQRDGVLQAVDRLGLGYLYQHVSYPVPEIRGKAGRLLKKDRKKVLEKVRERRYAGQIDFNEWRMRTRRFRLKLAIARETGVMPKESEYLSFMKSCQQASQFRELELAFYHFLDFYAPEDPHHQLRHRQGRQTRRQQQRAKEPQPYELIHQEFLRGLVRQDRMDHAQELLIEMRRRGMRLSVKFFGIMLEGYGRQMDLQKMRLTLKDLYASGQVPTLQIYTSLMANYIRAGEMSRAEEVCQQLLKRSDISMDAESRNVVDNLHRLRGSPVVAEGDAMSSKASGLTLKQQQELAKTKNDSTCTAADSSLVGLNSVIHYNHKLKRYADAMNMPRLVKTYKQLARNGLRPNTTTYNIILDAFSNAGRLEDGLQVLEHMKTTKEAQPDVVTFSTLIRGAVEEENVALGWSLYGEMRRRSIELTLHTYASLFNLIALDPSNKPGRAIVKEYATRGDQGIRFAVKPSVEDLVGLSFAGTLYHQLCNQGLRPNQYIFGGLLDLTVCGGYMDLAQHVYLEMIRQRVEPNTAIMTILIKGFAIRRDFESGWKVWKHMMASNIPRNVITYHHLIRLCERSLGNPIMVEEILASQRLDGKAEPFNKARGAIKKGMSDKEEQTPQGEQREKGRRKIKMKDSSSVKDVSSDHTARAPLTIMTEIRSQMSLDRVHWTRVQQFRKGIVERSIWDPIVVEVEAPVAPKSEASTEVEVMGSDGATLHAHRSRRDVVLKGPDLGTRTVIGSTSANARVREIFTGGGDLYAPRRGPPSRRGMLMAWDAEQKMPVGLEKTTPVKYGRKKYPSAEQIL